MMSAFNFAGVHKSIVKNGDVILHDGLEMTVSSSDIATSEFMGVCIFGDSYHCGYKKVLKGVLKSGRK